MKVAESEAKKKWNRDNMLLIGLKLHRRNDDDIIEFLTQKDKEKQKYIKIAIREYMANHPDELQ